MRYPPFRSLARRVIRLSFCLLASFTFATGAWAQTQITSGTIQGTVLDANGAAVPGALVTLRNTGTNLTRDLNTDEDGRFAALQLPPGRYTLTVSKQGFATLIVQDADVSVGQAMNLALAMKISSVQETVTITASPTVDTVKTESSTTLDEKTVNTTPILGRKFEDLLTLTPGVSVVQGPDGDEITFAGQRGVFNNVSLDGGDYNNGFFGEQLGGQRAAIDITLEAVKEFQVVATGANAEFGRTAGGIINVISKSGTNDMHGSLFHFQRLEALSAHTSDGKPLKDFRREQFGGTLGGPLRRDKAFFFFAFEGIRERLTRANLSETIGTPCPVNAPVVTSPAQEALINSSPDCQRLALINFISGTRGTNEGVPISHPIRNYSMLGKADFNLNQANQLAISYNLDYSKNTNQTFDVATYGASANGIEGLSKIHNINFNLFSTVSSTKVNEAHFSFSRENRPRAAIPSNVPADTGVGFGPSFRFGNPFFMQPAVDEILWRTHVKDNFSVISGNHNVKLGGEWIHTKNDQVFRGFFTGRYFFDSAAGFLRYASPAAAGGFGPNTLECANNTTGAVTFVTAPTTCPAGTSFTGGPLLLYLQNGISTGLPGVPAPGASSIKNEDLGLFVQDKWQLRPNFALSLGLRWEAQIFPGVIVPPSQTAYASLLNNPNFPSDGTLHSPKKELQPRVGFAWDIGSKGKSVLRASYGIFYGRQNMLTQVGSITDNGVQQYGIACASSFGCSNGAARPSWPNIVPVAPGGGIQPGSSVRVFSKDYANPRIYTTNVQFEQEVAPETSVYFDFTHAHGVHLTRFVNLNRVGLFPTLGDVFVTEAVGKSLYRGFTMGIRKRFSRHYQFEANYVLSKDMDDDSNERDPFTDRSFDPLNLALDYAPSDRDIRHKFNFFSFVEMPWKLEGNFRVQARSAQPITPAVRTATNRNSLRKDNNYFSFDWRLQRPFRFGFDGRYALTPIVEMFNTFNNKNLINPLSTAALFNFDGFLRQGVGDPRQLQLALRFSF
ncbi:MAG: hypothetical protein QOD33_119 [Pyrinomonadaceae bacterium]|nr:hypothetical protein [Pyrinomonadaceae bacterium]